MGSEISLFIEVQHKEVFSEVPIYEYQCKACGHIFECEHAIGENKKYKCPECSSVHTRKLISQVGVIFKGTGFYATDHRRNGGNGSGTKAKAKVKGETAEKASETPSPASEN